MFFMAFDTYEPMLLRKHSSVQIHFKSEEECLLTLFFAAQSLSFHPPILHETANSNFNLHIFGNDL